MTAPLGRAGSTTRVGVSGWAAFGRCGQLSPVFNDEVTFPLPYPPAREQQRLRFVETVAAATAPMTSWRASDWARRFPSRCWAGWGVSADAERESADGSKTSVLRIASRVWSAL